VPACSDSPREVFENMLAAAQKGDEEKFLDGFTGDSRPIVKSLLQLSSGARVSRRNPLQILTASEVTDEVIEGDRAYLTVKDNRGKTRLLMKRDGGKWKFDIFELEKFLREEEKKQ